MASSSADVKLAPTAAVQLIDVGMTFGRAKLFDRLSFEVPRGEFVVLLGPSGCGKSTVLRIIGGLIEELSGQVLIAGKPPRDAWSEIAFVFQGPRLAPWRTAIDNVVLGLELRFGRGNQDERKAKAQALLNLVGLASDGHKNALSLSGGERQRVAIARALAVDPSIILMDEPFSALDLVTRERLRTEVERIWTETRKTIVLVTHDLDEALQLADRIVLFSPKPTRIADIINVDEPRPRALQSPSLIKKREILRQAFQSISVAQN